MCSQALDLEQAVFEQRYNVHEGSATTSPVVGSLKATLLAHWKHRELLMLRLDLTTVGDVNLTVPLKDVGNATTADIGFVAGDATRFGVEGAVWLSGNITTTELPTSERVRVDVAYSSLPDSISVTSAQGTASVTLLMVLYSSLDGPETSPLDTVPAVLRLFETFQARSFEALLDSHVEAWEKQWTHGGIELAPLDEPTIQSNATAVNATLYYLRSALRADTPFSTSPGGLANSPAYNSHVFWDAETWMFPSLLAFQPDVAASMLEYRLDRVDAARENAAMRGFSGIMFPWESGFTGAEVIPDPSSNTEGELEQHIGGDIALAFVQQYYAQRVSDFCTKGYAVLLAVADFFAHRMTELGDSGKFGMLDVQPPDESAGRVNNSAYTNAIAAVTLRLAVNLGKSDCPKHVPNEAVQAEYLEMANNVYLPFDDEGQRHLEYDGYAGQTINQDDVGLLQYPLGWKMNSDVAYNDLDYYESVTAHNGYFTGNSAYGIAWLALGEDERAAAQFFTSFEHMGGPFLIWKEKAVSGGHLNFLTGAGGFLQNYVHGYGGVRYHLDHMQIDPTMPPLDGLTAFRLRHLHYLGNVFDVLVKHGATTIVPRYMGGTRLVVVSDDGSVTTISYTPVSVATGQVAKIMPSSNQPEPGTKRVGETAATAAASPFSPHNRHSRVPHLQ